ncbi:MAG: class I SAM-dependent methyltransferase [Candidatus Electrothrix sp. GW3-4]|uniref:class I SAM-dependent methyltransferase n=1 Tax=Candidatus Electrothrix sp. GW3-4 TaxID=3126740 RepID=UPI0030CD1556
MREDIKRYYRERLNNTKGKNTLWQVGKTVNGKEITDEQVNLIVATIAKRLNIQKTDFVLDIGCGNGLLTKKISGYVSEIVGLELTLELFDVSNLISRADNITYINSDIFDFDINSHKKSFDKIYLYEVIQHIDYKDADDFFSKLNDIAGENTSIFIGGVLDIEKKWSFFDSFERRCDYFSGIISGRNPLGTWYHKDFLKYLGKKYNFEAICFSQEESLYTAHYRFDCLLNRIR